MYLESGGGGHILRPLVVRVASRRRGLFACILLVMIVVQSPAAFMGFMGIIIILAGYTIREPLTIYKPGTLISRCKFICVVSKISCSLIKDCSE